MLMKLGYSAVAAVLSFVVLAFVVPFLFGFLASLVGGIVGGVLGNYSVALLACLAVAVFVFRNADAIKAWVDRIRK